MPENKSTVKSVANTKPTKIVNIDLIKKWEGLRTTAYMPTPNDVWTIGYGHTKHVKPGMTITEAEAEAFLREDVAWVESAIKTKVLVPITQNQFDALGSLIFNIGETAFGKSTLLRKLNEKDYKGAADQFLVWNKQKGKTLQGLVNRRTEERALFLR